MHQCDELPFSQWLERGLTNLKYQINAESLTPVAGPRGRPFGQSSSDMKKVYS